ncbi:MAG: Dipeptide transport system permease protein DppB [Elusimicrobia bacterium ADurb.Bin231]|nr:MAG: Dipeptide transport system permease protein DppB [Elusimicrobia bacterium ADurb.Bin231]
MINYILKRLLLTIPVLIGITIITFLVMNLSPGKPTDILTDMNQKITADAKERLVKIYGLDKPVHTRYFIWLKRIVALDFGKSFKDDRPVLKKILERLPATLLLNFLTIISIFALAIPIGVYSAVKKDTIFDKITTIFVFLGFSVPTFWLAIMLMIFFGLRLGWLPITGFRSINFDELSLLGKSFDIIRHLILPVAISSFTGIAALSRYTRSSMLEVLHQDYIRTARAKGLSEHLVIFKHALRNALIPVVTILGLTIPELIGGSFIFETIFAWPGMGRLGYDAIMARDYPVIMGIGTIVAVLTLLGNLIADITYAYVDPRIRYR